MRRDFTYIDDIVEGVNRCRDKPTTPDPGFDAAHPDPATSWAPHRLFNIGNGQPMELLHFIGLLEQALGREGIRQLEPIQSGDDQATAAYTRLVEQGIEHFARWYRQEMAPQLPT